MDRIALYQKTMSSVDRPSAFHVSHGQDTSCTVQKHFNGDKLIYPDIILFKEVFTMAQVLLDISPRHPDLLPRCANAASMTPLSWGSCRLRFSRVCSGLPLRGALFDFAGGAVHHEYQLSNPSIGVVLDSGFYTHYLRSILFSRLFLTARVGQTSSRIRAGNEEA